MVFLCVPRMLLRDLSFSGVNLEKRTVKIRLFYGKKYSEKSILEQEKNTKRLHLTKTLLITTVPVLIQAACQRTVLLGKYFQCSKLIRISAA